jgi:hypothetical protein
MFIISHSGTVFSGSSTIVAIGLHLTALLLILIVYGKINSVCSEDFEPYSLNDPPLIFPTD